MRVTIHDLKTWKTEGRRFAMLTAYDFPTARILDEAGIPVLLVGDSVGQQRPRLRERDPRDDGGHAPPHAGRRPRRASARWSWATCRSCRTRCPSRRACATPGAS